MWTRDYEEMINAHSDMTVSDQLVKYRERERHNTHLSLVNPELTWTVCIPVICRQSSIKLLWYTHTHLYITQVVGHIIALTKSTIMNDSISFGFHTPLTNQAKIDIVHNGRVTTHLLF